MFVNLIYCCHSQFVSAIAQDNWIILKNDNVSLFDMCPTTPTPMFSQMLNVYTSMSSYTFQSGKSEWNLCTDIVYDCWNDRFLLQIDGWRKRTKIECENGRSKPNNVKDKVANPKKFTFVFEGQFVVPYPNVAKQISDAMKNQTNDFFDKIRMTHQIDGNASEFSCRQDLYCNGEQADWGTAASRFISATKSCHRMNSTLRLVFNTVHKFDETRSEEAMYWKLKSVNVTEKTALRLWQKYYTWHIMRQIVHGVYKRIGNDALLKEFCFSYFRDVDKLTKDVTEKIMKICRRKKIMFYWDN